MRIKYQLLPKLKNLTHKEMDFFLFIVRYQDLYGFVPGVHNRDVCRRAGMCKQTFYTVMRSLEEKGIISCSKTLQHDYDILILDNDFSYPEAFREGYINLHRQVFRQKRFLKLRSNEKYMLMELLKRTHENSSSYQVGTQKFYQIFCEKLGVTKRVIRAYLHSLRQFFSVGIKDGKYFITYLHSVFRQEERKGVEEQEFEHFVKVQCRRAKLSYTEAALEGTARLIKQYRRLAWPDGSPAEQTRKGKDLLGSCIRVSARQGCPELLERYIHRLVNDTLPQKPF